MRKFNWERTPRAMAGILTLVLLMPDANAQNASEELSLQDPEIQSVESVLEQNTSTPKPEMQIRPNKPPGAIDFSKFKNTKAHGDQVIIQKTYMPKTNRAQIFGGLSLAMNDVFFRTTGGQLRLGYHFNETWGVEATGLFLQSSETQAIKDLSEVQKLGVENLSTPASMYGVNAYFNGIYGKMALEDRKIIPFEFYQTLGMAQVNSKPSSSSTAVYFGLGNLFSISKNSAIRADLSWYFYNSKTVKGESQSANTLFFTIGCGLFVPEAGRR